MIGAPAAGSNDSRAAEKARRESLSENERKLRQTFAEALNMSEADVNDDLRYANAAGWDSIAHMALVAALDDAFGIMLETDDVIDMSSYRKAREIVAKYGIDF
jgi:acyl carrier protein